MHLLVVHAELLQVRVQNALWCKNIISISKTVKGKDVCTKHIAVAIHCAIIKYTDFYMCNQVKLVPGS